MKKRFLKKAAALVCAFVFLQSAVFADTVFKTLVIIHNMEPVTNDGETFYPVHLYSAVDSLDYENVGFDINVKSPNGDENYQKTTSTVYKNMTVTDSNGDTKNYTAEDFGGNYIFGAELLFDSKAYKNATTELLITPFATKSFKTEDDAEKIFGTEAKINETTLAEKGDESLFKEEDKFETVFKNTQKYLYRVGNANAVSLGKLFSAKEGKTVESAEVEFEVTALEGNATADYSKNETDWTLSTLKFSNTGTVKLCIKENSKTAQLYLEVVEGKNVSVFSDLDSSNNNVLLGNIKITQNGYFNVTKTLFGNGFTFDISGGRNANEGIIYLSGGTLDNLNIVGEVYTTYAETMYSEYSSAAVRTSGTSKITNCCISNCRSAVRVYDGKLTVENSVLLGGRYANMEIFGGDVKLKNVTTVNMSDTKNKVLGLGIVFDGSGGSLEADENFVQYNWVKESDNQYIPEKTQLQTYFNQMFGYTDFVYEYSGEKYVNTGIISVTSDVSASDITGLPKDYASQTVSSATVFTVKKTSAEKYFSNGVPSFGEWQAEKQGIYSPKETWTYPQIYNSDSGKLLAVFTEGETFEFNPNFLSVSKHGKSLDVSVSMDGADYTGKNIKLDKSGEHILTYTYSDPYNYNASAEKDKTVTYTKTLALQSVANEPEAKNAEFSYTDGSGTKIVEIGGKNYVMPDVSATSDTIASTTVDGVTVYMPIVTAVYKNNSSDYDAYAPIFTAVNIKDFENADDTSGTIYDKSSTSCPENWGKSSGSPYINGAASTKDDPVKYSSYGLCYYSNKGSEISEQKQTVCFYYTDNTGKTFYYYIQYKFEAHKLCVPSGTMITLADGSKKAVENITLKDRVLAFNHEKGGFEGAEISFIENDGINDYKIVNLKFSDGTVTRLISEHGYFDLDLMKYVYITEDNYKSFEGHRFYKEDGSFAVLERAWITKEKTGCYSFPSKYHLNFVADGFLSMPGGIEGMFNIFEYNGDLSYNKEKMAEDIEKYGLFDYSDFKDYMTYEDYLKYPAPYLKVAIEKGILTEQGLINLINRYIR